MTCVAGAWANSRNKPGAPPASTKQSPLGGSWVVISRVISPLIWVITIVILLITPHITTHEPPSRGAP